MSIDKFKWLVSERRLFMPVATKLGDPFEGTTPQGELDRWRDEALCATSSEQREIIEQNRLVLSAFAKAFQGHYYVSCWHMNRYENDGMWKAYTPGSASVAIRTTLPILRGCLPNYVDIGIVRYIDYSTAPLPTMNMLEYIMHKRVHFVYEQEIRAVACGMLPGPLGGCHLNENLFCMTNSPEFRVYAPPIDVCALVQGVVLHPRATPEFAAEVSAFCADNALPPAEASRMSQAPTF